MNDPEGLLRVNNIIDKLDQSLKTQGDIDMVYDEWCDFIRDEMYTSIPHKTIRAGIKSKKFRPGKPWWCDRLTELWSEVCTTERRWLNSSRKCDKTRFRADYVSTRKRFDREVQRRKRLYWYSLQNNLLDECNRDDNEFWKSMGKVGIGLRKSKLIPMEVILEDGHVSSEISDVLHKWKTDFSSLFNKHSSTPSAQYPSPNDVDNLSYNDQISAFYHRG